MPHSHSTLHRVPEKVWVSLVLALGVVLRVLYAHAVPQPIVMPDTYGYNLVGHRIINGEMPFLNDERTPLYPLLFNTVMRLAGRTDVRLDTPQFRLGAGYIAIIHSIMSVLSILVFWQTLRFLRVPLLFRLILTSAYSVYYPVLVFERLLLTESLAISLTVLTVYTALKLIERPRPFNFGITVSLFLVLFLLRPVYIAFPVTLMPIVLFIHRSKRMVALTTISFFFFLVLPGLNILENIRSYNYPGINHITDVNVLGRILKDGIPTASAVGNRFRIPFEEYRESGRLPDPYYFLYAYDPSLLTRSDNRQELNELRDFASTVMKSELSAYVSGGIKDIPFALRELPVPPPAPTLRYSPLWNILYRTGTTIHFSLVVTYLLIPGILIAVCLRRPACSPYGFFLYLAISYLLSVTVLFGYSDFGRLLLPNFPILLICLGYGVSGMPCADVRRRRT